VAYDEGLSATVPSSVLDRVRDIVTAVVAPNAETVDRDAVWPEEAVRALQEAGLGGLTVPTAAGGLGFGLEMLTEVCETLGAACSSTGLVFGMHCVGSAVIAAKATPDHVERYLAPISEGRHFTTLALSEPGSGANFYIPQVEITRAGDEFVVNGSKTFVTNGSHADSYVISGVAAEPAPPGEFSCLVLREGTPGMSWGEAWHGIGMRGNDSRNLALRDVRVPAADLLGESGDEIWYVFNVIAPYFLAAMSGTYLGVAGAALELARAHVATRRFPATGSSLAHIHTVQHRLGELWAIVQRTRRFVYHAAASADAGAADALPLLCSAKAEVADAAVQVTREALDLSGGIGYRENARAARLLRDALAAPVMAPTTDMLRTWTARALLGLPLLAD